MNLVPPSEHQVLVFLVALLVLLVFARALGALARMVGQPPVIGELAAGLLLGPSVLGRLSPELEQWLFPPDGVQTAMLFTVAWLGVIFLLLATGFETDLGLIRRLGRAAGIVSTGSLVLPVVGGLAIGVLMPDRFLGVHDRTSFALFMGAALSISSLPVIAKILRDMGYIRRDFGQLTLAAGMANDVVGWIALGVIAGLVSVGTISLVGVLTTLAGVAAFFVVAFTAGQAGINAAFRALRRHDADGASRTTVLVICTLIAAATTQWLGVEAVLGAFVAGILVGRSPYRDRRLLEPVETVTTAFLAPVFFATAGLRVDLGLLSDPVVFYWGLIVIAVASLSKVLGALIGGTLARLPTRESAALGVALNARGALEIVIASVGLTLGVLNPSSYTVVVLMAMATSMMAPPLLRRVLRGWRGTPMEQERLRREELLESNLVVRSERVLVPTRGGTRSLLAAQVIALAWPTDTPVTVLNVGSDQDPADLGPLKGVLHEHPITIRARDDDDFARSITDESKLGYGAIVIGLSDVIRTTGLPDWVSSVIMKSQIPVVLVRQPGGGGRRTPWAFGRALVPSAGGRSAKASQEVAFGISNAIGTEVVIAHVTTTDEGPLSKNVASNLLAEASKQARNAGARVQTVERQAATASAEIVTLAQEVAADLVIVGATRKAVGGEHYLGQTATELLLRVRQTVIVVVLPESPQT